ncbi:MAG TPA: redoxin domain-containing protein [Kofleriaceae bacterium]|nr:redoxin domain-containing protein [Kofleriaceae bacterium]
MNLVGRLGLAIVRPRAAFALAGDRRNAGRSGSDLLTAILVLLVATQLRGIVGAIWLGTAVTGALGLRAFIQVLTDALVVDLGFLVVGALVIVAAGGGRRDVGRAFDLACVAALPLLYVDLAGSVVVTALGLHVPHTAMLALSGVAYAWTGALIAIAVIHTRKNEDVAPSSAARPAGWGLVVVALAGIALQAVWIARHTDRMRPMTQGDAAPDFSLPIITSRGKPAAPVTFTLSATRGQVVVLDFWATWCNPCLRSLPNLDQLQRHHPEMKVVAINIDDAGEAYDLFQERGYAMTLVEGDQLTSDRYGVAAIPHTVVIDKTGLVRRVLRGGGEDLEAVVAPLLK